MKRINRVAVVGMGVINSQGIGVSDGLNLTKSIPEYKSKTNRDSFLGYSKVSEIDTDRYLSGISLRCIDRTTIYTGVASRIALGEYLGNNNIDLSQVGMAIGTALGSIVSISNFDLNALANGPTSVNPMEFPTTVSNAPTSKVGIWFKLKGQSVTLSNGMTSSLDALGYAFDEISYGKGKYYLAGGTEEISREVHMGYTRVIRDKEIIGENRIENEILGEGSGVLFLSSMEEAIYKGYEIVGEITDFFSSKIPLDNNYISSVMGIIADVIDRSRINGENVSFYTSSLPYNKLSNNVSEKIKAIYGEENVTMLNKVENISINYLGCNGVFNTIFAINQLKDSSETKDGAIIFDVGCDGKISVLAIKY